MKPTNDDYLDAMLCFEFKHERYNYSAGNGYPAAVNKASCSSRMSLTIGHKYIIVDKNCESHFIPMEAILVKDVRRGGILQNDHWLLFKTETKQDMHPSGTYFLVRPRVSMFSGVVITFELAAEHCLGEDQNRKLIVREAEVI